MDSFSLKSLILDKSEVKGIILLKFALVWELGKVEGRARRRKVVQLDWVDTWVYSDASVGTNPTDIVISKEVVRDHLERSLEKGHDVEGLIGQDIFSIDLTQ